MKHFKIMELTATSTGFLNVPNMAQERCLNLLVDNVLDPVRYMFGEAIIVNSAFRSPAVNKAVGGRSSSAHLKGQAADISCSDNLKLFKLLYNNFNYTQLIWERGSDAPDWIHVSYDPDDLRLETLKFDGLIYSNYTTKK